MTGRLYDISHTSHAETNMALNAWAPLPSDEACPECGRALSWTDGVPVHAYAPGDQRRCTQDGQAASLRLTADLSTDGDETVIRLAGDLDLAAEPDLLALLRAAVSRPEMQTLILDLSGVGFMDSIGIGIVVQAARLCAEHHAELSVRAVGPRVRRILTIAGMTRTFDTADGAARTAAGPAEPDDVPTVRHTWNPPSRRSSRAEQSR